MAWKRKVAIAIISGVLIGLNFLTFLSAFPQMFGYDASGKARDFSAYYIAAWRFPNDPSRIYQGGAIAGQYPIYPYPAVFKYPPFFILLIIPFLLTGYQSAIVAFNILQFAMLPGIAVLIYKTMTWRNRSVLAMVPVLVLSLLAPFAAPQILFLQYRVKFVEAFIATGSLASLQDGFSNAYYWQWVEGNSRVLEMLLFFLSLYLATRKNAFSGVAFGLSTFDPRLALIALPITLAFNRASKNLPKFLDGLLITLSINIPLALYSNIGRQFVTEALRSGPFIFYAYEWIPFYSIIAFTIINLDAVIPRLGRAWKRLITLDPRGHNEPSVGSGILQSSPPARTSRDVLGNFNALSGYYVQVFVMGDTNFGLLRHSQSYRSLYNSGQVTNGYINVLLGTSNIYYLIYASPYANGPTVNIQTRTDLYY